jgi:hypothetical protein
MRNRVECDVCEGTGRTRPYGEREMRCHNECDNGFFPATATDLDGARACALGVVGYLFVWHGRLALEDETRGELVVLVDPLTVEVLR